MSRRHFPRVSSCEDKTMPESQAPTAVDTAEMQKNVCYQMSLENLGVPSLAIFPYAGLIRASNMLIYVVNFPRGRL